MLDSFHRTLKLQPPQKKPRPFLFGSKVVSGTGMLLALRLVEPVSSGSRGLDVAAAWDCGEAQTHGLVSCSVRFCVKRPPYESSCRFS